jgi:hypothetical protein
MSIKKFWWITGVITKDRAPTAGWDRAACRLCGQPIELSRDCNRLQNKSQKESSLLFSIASKTIFRDENDCKSSFFLTCEFSRTKIGVMLGAIPLGR